MRLSAVASVLALISLVGCAGMAQQQAKEQFAKDRADCKASIPRTVGNFERREQCIADAMDRDLSPAFQNDGARFSELEAQLVLLGQKVDKGQLTAEDANAQYTQFQAGVVADSEQAVAERREAAAANAASSAQMLAAAAALMQAGRPTYAPSNQPYQVPEPVHTTCTQTGMFTDCTSQ